MKKQRVLLFLALSVISLVSICFCMFFLKIGLWNYWFVCVATCVGGLPIVLLFRELDRGAKNKFLKLVYKWPLLVWVVGASLSIIYVFLAISRGR